MLYRVPFGIFLYTKENKYNVLVVSPLYFPYVLTNAVYETLTAVNSKGKLQNKRLTCCKKGLLQVKSIKAKCRDVLQNQNVTVKIRVQYMALCNTVHYSYSKHKRKC